MSIRDRAAYFFMNGNVCEISNVVSVEFEPVICALIESLAPYL